MATQLKYKVSWISEMHKELEFKQGLVTQDSIFRYKATAYVGLLIILFLYVTFY